MKWLGCVLLLLLDIEKDTYTYRVCVYLCASARYSSSPLLFEATVHQLRGWWCWRCSYMGKAHISHSLLTQCNLSVCLSVSSQTTLWSKYWHQAQSILCLRSLKRALGLTALLGSMRGLSMAIVMQLRKMMTNTMWSNILWVMILLHRTRNLTENTERWETSGKRRWIW